MKWLLATLISLSINGILLSILAELQVVEKRILPPPAHLAVHLIVKEAQVASAPPASEIIPLPVVEKPAPPEPPVQVLTTPKAALRTVPPPAPKKPKPEKPIKEKPVKKAEPPIPEPPIPEPPHQFKKAAPIPPSVAKNPAPPTAVKNPAQDSVPQATGHEAAVTKPSIASSGQSANPKPIVRVEPIYPRMAKAQGITGSVVVEFTITATGEVENIQIIKADPEDVFEEAVEQALAQWQFSPQLEQGVAVARRARQTIRFNLNNGN
jgi:protein TonB